MSTLWIHFRRLAASLMLVAVASLVLHGAAMAGPHPHSHSAIDCSSGHSGHGDRAGELGVLENHLHHGAHHAEEVRAGLSDDGRAADGQDSCGVEAPCCASSCATAASVIQPDGISSPVRSGPMAIPGVRYSPGTDVAGLTRPPRTPDIA